MDSRAVSPLRPDQLQASPENHNAPSLASSGPKPDSDEYSAPLPGPLPQRPATGGAFGREGLAFDPVQDSLSNDMRNRPASSSSLHPRSSDTRETKPKTPKPSTPKAAGLNGTATVSSSSAGGGGATGADASLLAGPGYNAPRSPDTNRPLNVTDALSYLDAVKLQFQDKPDVYNHFLDIMKDFKSELLDTPGVIQRVSMLFQGNPYLIQGFNTFLPPGYRIDCSTDPHDTTIMVTTPTGVVTQSTLYSSLELRALRETTAPPSVLAPLGPFGEPPPILPIGGIASTSPSASRPTSPVAYQFAPPFHGAPAPYSPGLIGTTTAAASLLGNLNNRNPVENGEFNHAIQYLNKIKTRFADDTNTYKQFLEILQNYQKEQRHLHDSQVYARVQMLFKDAPDLLNEFKDFLPEAVGQPAVGLIGIVPQPVGGPGMAGPSAWEQQEPAAPPIDKPEKPKAPLKRRKRPAEKEPTPAPATKGSNRAKRAKTQHKPDPQSPPFSPYQRPASPSHAHGHTHTHSHQISSSQSVPHAPTHSQTIQQSNLIQHTAGSAVTTTDELMFFDRAKRALEGRDTYDEFLKLLNLFSKDVINTKTLVEKAQVFLGDSDLLVQFKDLMGWDDKQGSIEHGPPGSIRTGPPEPLMAWMVEDGESPSYRRLPPSERRLACSGRDQLGRSVLNDEWVSHPTWASEESGFVAHKKNTNEEALHKSEEERHEYWVHLEALSRVIALLEPLTLRIDEMTHDERTLFKLKPDLGGASPMMYQRVLKRVYGREGGMEVYDFLQECPSVAVPVVLARLKRRDEDWRRAQREWSRTWREADAKNFYKSLDYQGILFKASDKKNITAKHFVADIESIKADKEAREMRYGGQFSFTRGSVGFQLEYSFEDTSVLVDAMKMVYHFLERSQAQYSRQERRRLERFLHSFIPLLCMQTQPQLGPEWGSLDGGLDDDLEDGIDTTKGHNGGMRSTSGGGQGGGVPPGDLRKKLLKTAQERGVATKAGTTSLPDSRLTSPEPGEDPLHLSDQPESKGDFSIDEDDIWIQESVSSLPEGSPKSGHSPVKRRPLFANTTFYTLLRLVQLLYSRLLECKETGAKLAAIGHEPLRPNPIAVELGLDEPNGPSTVLSQAIETFSDDSDSNVLYKYLLDACEKVFDNEMDQATFEDQLRWFFGTKAFHVFTIDKLIIALVKQVHTIVTDNKCQELWFLLQKARGIESPTTHNIIGYRREAEQHVGADENLYRIEWDRPTKIMRIQLVGIDDASVDEDNSASGRWREYVDTFVLRHRTEWMPLAKSEKPAVPVFLKRCLSADDAPSSKTIVQNRIAVRISLGTYKLFYEAGTEDFVWQQRSREEESVLHDRAVARHEERKRCPLLLLE